MKIFGIDPGSNATGFAAVSRHQGRYVLHDAGTIRTSPKQPIPERLHTIHAELEKAIARTRPDAVSIEVIFQHRSSESALRLGHARGVALLAAAQAGLPVAEYNPSAVKLAVAGHGGADKEQVSRMVIRLLGLQATDPVLSADAYSAFEEGGVLNPAIGGRFHDEILAVGGSRPAMQSFVAFRGRKPTIDALLRHHGMVN